MSHADEPHSNLSTSRKLKENKLTESESILHEPQVKSAEAPPTPQSQHAADYELASGERGVDQAWYLFTYPDVAAAGADPVEHYLQHGWREGRDPRPDFSTSDYLEAYKESEGNPLLHYLRSKQEVAADETAVIDWYLLWKKQVLFPKGENRLFPNSTLGSRGVSKIVFTGHAASRTGAPLILLRLMEAIQALTGTELYLILERGGPLIQDYQRIAHVFVNQNGMFHLSSGPTNLTNLLNSIAAPRPALAICNCAGSWRLSKALREAGLPLIVNLIHERVTNSPAEVWLSLHQNSNRIIFPAEAVKAVTASAYPIFNDACVVPQGLLDPDFGRGDRSAARLEIRNKLGLSPDTFIILGCGTRDLRKGIDLFVQLAALIRARTRHDVHFVWLGAPDSRFTKLIELDIDLLKISSTVSLLDAVEDPEPYFLAADAFALTSRNDPFPCVIHEAMACALPIVAFDSAGGAKEALSGDCGIVLPYLDVEAVALTLTEVIERPSEHAVIGQRAQTRVRSVYRFSDYAERIWKICQSLEPIKVASPSPAALVKANDGVKDSNPQVPLAERKQWLDVLLEKVGRTIRAEQWWDHKLVPIFAVFYAFAYMQQVSIASLWPSAVMLLLAIASCATYVSLINDVTDRADDRRAGKPNRMEGKPVWQMAMLLAAPLCAALLFITLWRNDIALVAAYLGSWLAFSLYSIPPFRLKNRGVLGVFADACGSHVFPTLTAILLAQRATGHPVELAWTAAAVAWALGCGLRGILWHQHSDAAADRKAAVQTFIVKRSPRSATNLTLAAALLECAGLGVLLWQIKSPWAVVFLLLYVGYAVFKSRLWNIAIVLAKPREQYSLLGREYYTFLLPLGPLLSSTLHYPADWAVILVHLIVFTRPAKAFIAELPLLLLDAARAKS